LAIILIRKYLTLPGVTERLKGSLDKAHSRYTSRKILMFSSSNSHFEINDELTPIANLKV